MYCCKVSLVLPGNYGPGMKVFARNEYSSLSSYFKRKVVFLFVSDEEAMVFVPGKPSQPSLNFASKTEAYTIGVPWKFTPTGSNVTKLFGVNFFVLFCKLDLSIAMSQKLLTFIKC